MTFIAQLQKVIRILPQCRNLGKIQLSITQGDLIKNKYW